MYNTKTCSAASATPPLASTKIKRRDPTERDVQIEILFCGICHSDSPCGSKGSKGSTLDSCQVND